MTFYRSFSIENVDLLNMCDHYALIIYQSHGFCENFMKIKLCKSYEDVLKLSEEYAVRAADNTEDQEGYLEDYSDEYYSASLYLDGKMINLNDFIEMRHTITKEQAERGWIEKGDIWTSAVFNVEKFENRVDIPKGSYASEGYVSVSCRYDESDISFETDSSELEEGSRKIDTNKMINMY